MAALPARRPPWTGAELATLRRLYPSGGAKAVGRVLPGRTIGAIYDAARMSKIRRVGPSRGRKAVQR